MTAEAHQVDLGKPLPGPPTIGFLGNRSINGWLVDRASGLITLTLGRLLLVTMPIMPFIEQYARDACHASTGTDPSSKRSPSAQPGMGSSNHDHRAEQHGCGTPPRAGRLESKTDPLDLILNWVVTIAILVFMMRFTAIYPDRAQKAARGRGFATASHGRAEAALHKRLSGKCCS